MKFGNDASNNLLIQAFCVLERKVPEAGFEVDAPLAHDIVRGDFLWFGVVGNAPGENVVGIGVPFCGDQKYIEYCSLRYSPLALLEGPRPFRKNELVTTSSAYNSRRRIPLRMLAVGMVQSSEAAAGAHLFSEHVSRARVLDYGDEPPPDW